MDLIVRMAEPGDIEDLAEISRNTWEGHDYLETVAEEWFSQGGFMVGELSGRVIACGKITGLPGGVAWLEGLRVHPDFRGKGYGRIVSQRILERSIMLMDQGKFESIEFSTYINNVESRTMAEAQGFRITESFHVLGFEDPVLRVPPVQVNRTEISLEDLSIYREHAPCGWKYIYPDAEGSIEWMKAHSKAWVTENGARFLTANRGFEFSPLASSVKDPAGFLHGVLSLLLWKDMDYGEMMVHDDHKSVLSAAIDSGFTYWEDDGVANIPLYRYIG